MTHFSNVLYIIYIIMFHYAIDGEKFIVQSNYVHILYPYLKQLYEN